jgi:CDP-paratose 2-epimerase
MYELEKYLGINTLGTAVLLEALMEHPVETLVVASRMSIDGEGLYRAADGGLYAQAERSLAQLQAGLWEVCDVQGNVLEPLPTPEHKPPALASIYALSKYNQERMCLMIGRAYHIPTVALRFFSIFGPRQALSNPYTAVLAIFASRYLNDQPPMIFEDGLQQRDGSVPTTEGRFRAMTQRDGTLQEDTLSTPLRNRAVASRQRPVLITGGAGFIGTNLAHRLLSAGHDVLIFDNLSRPGVEHNLQWLCKRHGKRVRVCVADMRDASAIHEAVQQAAQVFHLAAQVAVTTSVLAPKEDFEVNALGTVNLLEALRQLKQPPPLVFTSTNKVYGNLQDGALRTHGRRYEPTNRALLLAGINENRPLAFYSPYGCSKGAADQYVMDYARIYGLPAVVFRMSCIYGPHQCGTEDQGWVAHFLMRALARKPITLYGNGLQVRDILFVHDLVNALLLVQTHMPTLAGQVFNIGGGTANTTSLLELLALIAEIHDQKPVIRFAAWRPGDQTYYASDIRRFSAATGWVPQVNIRQGVAALYTWLLKNHMHGTGQHLTMAEVECVS